MLFDDLGRLAEALVDVERSFGTCEEEIIQSLVQAGSGSESGGDSSGGSLYDELTQLSQSES